jgi:two-component system, NarL family, nitrate/nitrite response regulator NarL
MIPAERSPSNDRVTIVSSEPLIRAGLAAYFQSEPGWEVLSVDLPSPPAAGWMMEGSPDLVVWDTGGEETSLDLLRQHLPRLPATLVLSGSAEEAEAAWAAGARAVLHRHVEAAVVLAAARAVLAGLWASDLPLSRPPAAEPSDPEALPEPLTARELQVLRLLADGLPNKLISARLGVTESTVKYHVNAILGKLDARSRTEAVVRAGRMGLIPL